MSIRRRLPIVALAIGLLLSSVPAAHSQPPDEDCDYFPETGHFVCGDFLDYYHAQGGVEFFGYPLSEAFQDETRGLYVQYFQRVRMEWHPYETPPHQVQLGQIVDELGLTFLPARPEEIPLVNGTYTQYFPETQHVVKYDFLAFFKEKGGIDVFGYPRSESLSEKGHVVQYFQRACMEWHPGAAYGPEVRLANLVEEHIEHFVIPAEHTNTRWDPAHYDPNQDPTITRLSVFASVRHAVTAPQGSQRVFVFITDQRGEPVEGAGVQAIIRGPSGDELCPFSSTDGAGFAQCSFQMQPASPGQKVVIDVQTAYGPLAATTQTSYLPWR